MSRPLDARGHVERRDARLAAAADRREPRRHERPEAVHALGVVGRVLRRVLQLAVVRLPAHAEVEGLLVGRAIPQVLHGLAGPVLFAEVVATAEEAPRGADEAREGAPRGVEVARIAGERRGAGERERGLSRVVEELHVDGPLGRAVVLVHELPVGPLLRRGGTPSAGAPGLANDGSSFVRAISTNAMSASAVEPTSTIFVSPMQRLSPQAPIA